ncbi:MAG: hypothetical protein ABJ000_00585 [Saccharospirillum sp.]|uniref:hypothetical protein n=1 Tax=Saccharospirillum sp. TaxID=2033801 RepID=UPI00329700CA
MDSISSIPVLRELDFSQKLSLQRLYQKERKGVALSIQEQDFLDQYREELIRELNKTRSVWPAIILLSISVLLYLVFST